MKKLFCCMMMIMMLGCQTVPKELRAKTDVDNQIDFPFSFKVMAERDFKPISYPDYYTKSLVGAKVHDSLQKSCGENSLEEKGIVGYLTYDIEKAKAFYNYDTYVGACFHTLSLGVLTLGAIPWGNRCYDFRFIFKLYNSGKTVVKEYAYNYNSKIVQGLYYGHGDLSYIITEKLLNDFYSDLKKDEEKIIKYFSK